MPTAVDFMITFLVLFGGAALAVWSLSAAKVQLFFIPGKVSADVIVILDSNLRRSEAERVGYDGRELTAALVTEAKVFGRVWYTRDIAITHSPQGMTVRGRINPIKMAPGDEDPYMSASALEDMVRSAMLVERTGAMPQQGRS